ncbi:hypothetical protein [Amycolatopsis sp. EV170708-02-1]|uniref:hypothetical protein n=1 Tax=Amycolatopsis sp. EV170708-02-1 TaxID=2919322 RepID=UPI001F0C601B|nr:hypothetical protein [Amycolatopsis sp. EV170708-02-1]UMP01642.1 hypothetical protein MJQ72_35265 [Amycolatopsis sp. EV170708-02-1]
MTINMMLTNPGTRLSCVAEVPQAQRQGTFVPVSILAARGTQRFDLGRIAADETFSHAAAFGGAYENGGVDLPVIKQFRVPLSIRERSS